MTRSTKLRALIAAYILLAAAGCTTGRNSLLATTDSGGALTPPFQPAADAVVVTGPERSDVSQPVTITAAGVEAARPAAAAVASNLLYVSGNVALPGATLPGLDLAAGLSVAMPLAGNQLVAAQLGATGLGAEATLGLQAGGPGADPGPNAPAAPLPQVAASTQASASSPAGPALLTGIPPLSPPQAAALSTPGQAVQFAGDAQVLTRPVPSLATPALPAGEALAGAVNTLKANLPPAATPIPGL